MKIGVGICTFNRPDGLDVLLESIKKYCLSTTDLIYIYDDCSDKAYKYKYERIINKYKFIKNYQSGKKNKGVAYAKNKLLLKMLYDDCDWIFLLEDDIEITDSYALNGYIEACKNSGLEHLSFHCPSAGLNVEPLFITEYVTLWPHLAGALCIYSRHSLLRSGLLDENFYNAWEHVDHTQRIAQRGFTLAFKNGNADATRSEKWVRDQNINSVIRSKEGWIEITQNQNFLWHENYKDTWDMVFDEQSEKNNE